MQEPSNPFSVLDRKWNPFSHTKETRRAVFIVSLGALFMWGLKGFDSGIGEYGTSLHWSVFVIYGLMFVGLNYYYDKYLGIQGTRNFVYCFSFTIMAVGLFEFYWMFSYFFFQGQKWILFDNQVFLIQNIGITLVGIIALLHVRYETSWRLRRDEFLWWTWSLLLVSIIWWYLNGFKQTSYPQANGTWIYIENNYIHLINLVCKVFFSLAIMVPVMFKVKKV